MNNNKPNVYHDPINYKHLHIKHVKCIQTLKIANQKPSHELEEIRKERE